MHVRMPTRNSQLWLRLSACVACYVPRSVGWLMATKHNNVFWVRRAVTMRAVLPQAPMRHAAIELRVNVGSFIKLGRVVCSRSKAIATRKSQLARYEASKAVLIGMIPPRLYVFLYDNKYRRSNI